MYLGLKLLPSYVCTCTCVVSTVSAHVKCVYHCILWTLYSTYSNCSCLMWVPVNSNCSCLVSSEYLGLGCPLISLRSETKRNGSENERSEIAKKRFSFACFALKRNRIFCMRNEMIRSEKYRKYRKKGFQNTSQTSEDDTVLYIMPSLLCGFFSIYLPE